MTRPDVAVVGGGVIGLAVAWRCAQRGMRVAVVDPTPGSGASGVAAGMLAPVTEAHFGEEPLLRLALASAERWPRFAEELTDAAGGAGAGAAAGPSGGGAGELLGYRTDGTVLVAYTDDDLRAVRQLHRFYQSLGLPAEALTGRDCRARVPVLSPRVRGGMYAAGDHQVDPRRLTRALLRAATGAGVHFDRRRVERLADLDAGHLVLAAGCWSGHLAHLPVRPVKGQILRLAVPDGCTGFAPNVRAISTARSVYLVPRTDGEVVVGATVEERGHDTTVTAGGVHDLLRAAIDVLPEVAEYHLAESRAGLRPGTPDNAPLLGPTADPRVIAATGHYRQGILLAPVTADTVADLVSGGEVAPEIRPFDPLRFGPAARNGEPAAGGGDPVGATTSHTREET